MCFVERVVWDHLDVVFFADTFVDWRIFLSIRVLLHSVSGDVTLYLGCINIGEAFAGVFGAKINKMWVTHDPTLIEIKNNFKFPFHQEFAKFLNACPVVFSIVHGEMAGL